MMELPAKEVYLYAKIAKLNGKVYNRNIWRLNKTTKTEDFSEDTVTKYTSDLKARGYIDVKKVVKVEGQLPTNKYTVKNIKDAWTAVYNDFIDLPFLSADEKGFAIKLNMLKFIPDSYSAVAKLTSTSDKTVKKYMETLKKQNIIVDGKLSPVYFPEFEEKIEKTVYKEDGPKKVKKTAKQLFEEELQNTMILAETSERIKKQVEQIKKYMQNMTESARTYKFGTQMLQKVQAGTFKAVGEKPLETELESIIL